MIKIFTDSTSYLPKKIQEENNITVLPFTISVDGKEYLETEISNENFYSIIKKSGKMAKTTPLQVEDFIKAFEKDLIEGNTIVGVFIGSKMSDTYGNAVIAKNKLLTKYPRANITVIDSQSNSMQEGLAVLAAAETAKSGAWLEDIIKAADNNINHTRFIFMPDTLKYLEIGGRLGKAQALIGSALQIMPILMTQNGEVVPRETVRKKSKAMNKLLEILEEDIEKYGIRKVIINHIDCIDKAQELAKKAEELSRLEVSICDLGPAVGANVGPGAIGIVYETIEALPNE